MSKKQLSLLEPVPLLPEGFKYQPELIGAAEEEALLRHVRELPFKEFEFHGFTGKRRTVSYGWHYDFSAQALRPAEEMPPFLLSLRDTAARFAGISPERFQQALVIEYDAGASIGWHRDKQVFGEVIGISLLSPCRFRFRRKAGSSWDRISISAEPRSAYLLRGASRTEWEHSIPAVDSLRYSITYRNLRDSR